MDKTAPLWTKIFVIIIVVNMLAFFGFNMTIVGFPVYVASLGANDVIVGLVNTFNAVAALAIRPFSGLILDRVTRRNVLLAGLAIMGASTLASAAFPIAGVILGLRLLHGVGWGFSSAATSTLAADVIPTSRFAEGMGYVGLATALTTAVAPALALALLHSSGAVAMIVVSASSPVLSASSMGVQPYCSLIVSISARLSERWVCIGTPIDFAAAAISR